MCADQDRDYHRDRIAHSMAAIETQPKQRRVATCARPLTILSGSAKTWKPIKGRRAGWEEAWAHGKRWASIP